MLLPSLSPSAAKAGESKPANGDDSEFDEVTGRKGGNPYGAVPGASRVKLRADPQRQPRYLVPFRHGGMMDDELAWSRTSLSRPPHPTPMNTPTQPLEPSGKPAAKGQQVVKLCVAVAALAGAGFVIWQQLKPRPAYEFNAATLAFTDHARSNAPLDEVDVGSLEFQGVDGQPVDLKKFRGRNVVLVVTRGNTSGKGQSAHYRNICLYCATQISRLIANYQAIRDADAEVVVVFPIRQAADSGSIGQFHEALAQVGPAAEPPFPLVLDVELRGRPIGDSRRSVETGHVYPRQARTGAVRLRGRHDGRPAQRPVDARTTRGHQCRCQLRSGGRRTRRARGQLATPLTKRVSRHHELDPMHASDASPTRRDFLTIAGELTLLSPDVLDELALEATEKQINPGQLALQKRLLDAAQIDIIETLLRPTEAVPGYEILSVLGQGGMGVVYQARQLNLKRVVALKTVLLGQLGQPSALERFEQEAQAVARLAHPHIVAAYDFGRHEGRLYFAMELVSGEDVYKLIRRRGALAERIAWSIVRQAAAGLAHAAHHGIVHRDIKPANLLLVEPPTGFPLPAGLPMVKIADFGLAQLAVSSDERTRLTSPNAAVGSPNYMSPEQLLGEPVDLRTDIFALGASAFHMLTGKPPLAGKAPSQIIAQRMSGQRESLAELRPDLARASVELVAAMMAHDPRDRLPDYRELTRRIDALELASPSDLATVAFHPTAGAGGQPAQPLPVKSTGLARRLPRGVGLKWLTVAALAVAAGFALVGTFFRSPSLGTRDLQPSGRIEELFQGQSINAWKAVSGGWSQVKDHEGGAGAARPRTGSPGDRRAQRGGRAADAVALSAFVRG